MSMSQGKLSGRKATVRAKVLVQSARNTVAVCLRQSAAGAAPYLDAVCSCDPDTAESRECFRLKWWISREFFENVSETKG